MTGIEQLITTYITAKTLPKLIKPLLKAYKEIGSQRRQQLQEIDDNFGSCQALAQLYIEPNCQQTNPADECEDDALSTVRTNIFSTINNFLNRDIVIKDNGNNQMFVLADAGMGKTSLLMILKLTHLMNFWPPGYHCQLLKLGERSLQQIKAIKDKSNTLLLLDSLDEDIQCKDGKVTERLTELLEHSKCFKRVIITCRTQFFPEANSKEHSVFNTLGKISFAHFSCPLVYLSLFNETQVATYLKKRFPRKYKHYLTLSPNPDAVQASKALNKIDSLQFRPFLLAHIKDILQAATDGANEYELYFALIDAWIMREIAKLRDKGKSISKQDLLLVSIWLAEDMTKKGSQSIALAEIEKLCYRETSIVLLEEDPEKVIKGVDEIDIGTNSLLNRNSKGEFRFSHLSIREFLLIYGIEKQHITAVKRPLLISDKMRRFLTHATIPQPFQLINNQGGYVLNSNRLVNITQLNGHDFKHADVNWIEFLDKFLAKKTWKEIAFLELYVSFLKLLELLERERELRNLERQEREQRNLERRNLELLEQRELLEQKLQNLDLRERKLQELQELRELERRNLELLQRELRNLQGLRERELQELKEVERELELLKRELQERELQERELQELKELDLQELELELIKIQKDYSKKQPSKTLDKAINLISHNLSGLITEKPEKSPQQISRELQTKLTKAPKLTNWLANQLAKRFNYPQLQHIDLSNAQLKNANFSRVNLSGANFINANLTGANFIDAYLNCADLTNADLTGADLTGADLTGAILTGTGISKSKLNQS